MNLPAPIWHVGGRWLSVAVFTLPWYALHLGIGRYIVALSFGRVPTAPPFPPTQPE